LADLGIVNGNLNIISGAILDLQQLGSLGSYVLNDKFTLFAYQGFLSGFFEALLDGETPAMGTLADGGKLFDDQGGLWMINYFDTTAGLNGGTTEDFSYVTITAVPEPNVIALLGGLGLLTLLRRRR
jgi:hypothetical protein